MVNYSTELFDAATITSLIQHFVQLLESIVARPERTIDTLEIYSDIEKNIQQQLKDQRRATHRSTLKNLRRGNTDTVSTQNIADQ
jgi:non-ribosomal peptide synthetase component F